MKCSLYRHFDAEGDLLYVGISIAALARLQQHKKSRWVHKIETVKIELFETRELAVMAEAKAIEEENPAYNIQRAGLRKRPTKPKCFDSIDYSDGAAPVLVFGTKELGGIKFDINNGCALFKGSRQSTAFFCNSNIMSELMDEASEWFRMWALSSEAVHITDATNPQPT